MRAELTQVLSRMKESENKMQEAHDLLQEEAVDTFTGMVGHKKVDYLLGKSAEDQCARCAAR